MSAEQEMRRVLQHAADGLMARRETDRAKVQYCSAFQEALQSERIADLVAVTYAEAVLRLLVSYLAVEDAPRGNPTGGRP